MARYERPWRQGLVGYDPDRVSAVETDDPDAVTDLELAAMEAAEGRPDPRRAYVFDESAVERDTSGRFAPKGGGGEAPPDAVGKMMSALADPDSGMTISRDGDVPTTGYIVAVEGHSAMIPAAEFTADREKATDFVDQYLAANAEALDSEGMMLGLWNDPGSGNIIFDVVEHVPDREEAVRLGAERDQIAIFDLEALDVVSTGGTGGVPQDGAEQATQASVADDSGGTTGVRSDPRRPDGLISLPKMPPTKRRWTGRGRTV